VIHSWVNTKNLGNTPELQMIRKEMLDGVISYDNYLAKKGILLQEDFSQDSHYHIY
jgi:predicted RNA-binding protein with PIN domain